MHGNGGSARLVRPLRYSAALLPRHEGRYRLFDNAPFPQPSAGSIVIDWGAEFCRLYAEGNLNSISRTLELAKAVSRARKHFKRQWAAFWSESGADMPFKKRAADMLVGVARLAGVSEHTVAHLPRGWTILYPLSRLDHAQLQRLVHNGTVHPQLTLAEARRLVRRTRPSCSQPRRPKVKKMLKDLAAFMDTTLDDWSLEQTQLACLKFREFALRSDKHLSSTTLATPTTPNGTRITHHEPT